MKKLLLVLLIVAVAVGLGGCDGANITEDRDERGTSETYILTVEKTGEGTVTPETGAHQYSEVTVVNLEAVSASGWEFSHWQGEVAAANDPKTTVIVDGNKTVRAVFNEEDDSNDNDEEDGESIYNGRVVIEGNSPGKQIELIIENENFVEIGTVKTDSMGFYTITSDLIEKDDVIRIVASVLRNYQESYVMSKGLATWVYTDHFTVAEGNWDLPELDLYAYGLKLVKPAIDERVSSFPYQVEINEYKRNMNQNYWLYFYDINNNFVGHGAEVFAGKYYNFDGRLYDGSYLNQDAFWHVSVFYEEKGYMVIIDTWGNWVFR